MRAVIPPSIRRSSEETVQRLLVIRPEQTRPKLMAAIPSQASKGLFSCSKQKVDTCGIPKMVFVGIASSHERR